MKYTNEDLARLQDEYRLREKLYHAAMLERDRALAEYDNARLEATGLYNHMVSMPGKRTGILPPHEVFFVVKLWSKYLDDSVGGPRLTNSGHLVASNLRWSKRSMLTDHGPYSPEAAQKLFEERNKT